MVGALAGDFGAPDDFAGEHVKGYHVGEAGAGDVEEAAVVGGEHIVHQLVVPLADQVTDQAEKETARQRRYKLVRRRQRQGAS